jgi:hypothetical protein
LLRHPVRRFEAYTGSEGLTFEEAENIRVNDSKSVEGPRSITSTPMSSAMARKSKGRGQGSDKKPDMRNPTPEEAAADAERVLAGARGTN